MRGQMDCYYFSTRAIARYCEIVSRVRVSALTQIRDRIRRLRLLDRAIDQSAGCSRFLALGLFMGQFSANLIAALGACYVCCNSNIGTQAQLLSFLAHCSATRGRQWAATILGILGWGAVCSPKWSGLLSNTVLSCITMYHNMYQHTLHEAIHEYTTIHA